MSRRGGVAAHLHPRGQAAAGHQVPQKPRAPGRTRRDLTALTLNLSSLRLNGASVCSNTSLHCPFKALCGGGGRVDPSLWPSPPGVWGLCEVGCSAERGAILCLRGQC